MALRYKRIKNEEEWKNMNPNPKICKLGICNITFQKTQKRIMFPTSHDLTMDTWEYWMPVLSELIISGSKILIVTKADSEVIDKIIQYINTSVLEDYKKNIEFRITITGTDEETRRFWEPGAPSYNSRIKAIDNLLYNDFKTSVLIEPLLTLTPLSIIAPLYDSVSEIWIGTMNHVTRSSFTTDAEKKFFDQVQVTKDPKFLWHLRRQLERFEKGKTDSELKIRWKDSIRQIFEQSKTKEAQTTLDSSFII
jgi:DNA repair photolyase